ncbi:hypothetical protein CAFEA_03835 [Corynebacterium afermentans subsp. afermentans]|uniref:Uncharacterized protein n=1 Tax=Corynebacterium afermentans TaxID=38286 RepID=A0A9X8WHW7_9CORY|nr:hypothetical protein [Corynebacterium afermentans]MDC7108649.1 hypothetical protein [Corynebacterium afermentans]OAA16477.1 hypothetical protein Caferm_02000 [Corynebacterium afermentans subsp. afermentans]WJY56381.1 hypothetical protein CAFEA_03835 [Corynebacterium afermentans subsp. afermentans]SIQ25601.1 hypothetical protein SAMN05421802_10975 [Corynebacterium afermentans]
MPDSFSELRTAGGPNKPWVVGGVLALIVAIIGVALAAAYWYANPKPAPVNEVPETVTVTAQPQPIDDPPAATETISGTFTGTLNSLEDDAKVKAWPAVATFGGGTASVTYPLTGCTALIGGGGESIPLTKGCNDGQGRWDVEKRTPGVVKLTYLEDDIALVEGELSAGLP